MKLINSEMDKLIYKDNRQNIYYIFIKSGNSYTLKMIINNVDNFIVDSELYDASNVEEGNCYKKIVIYLEDEIRTIDFDDSMSIINDQIRSNDSSYVFDGNNYVNGDNIYDGNLINNYYLHYFLNSRILSNKISSNDKVVRVKKQHIM